jgi:dTDP-glucose 4,6-dehydratase
MNILITGGAGFIGSNFCHYYYNESDRFVVLDALTYAGDLEFIKDLIDKPNFRFVHGNITDARLVNELFSEEKFDVVINFAAETNVDTSVNNPQIFIDTNITGVRVLLDACRDYAVDKFHQVSTDDVYGELLDKNGQFFEDSPLNPTNPYSVSKAAADLLVLSYYRIFGLHTTISRCSNNYGIYQHYEKFIPKSIRHVINNENIPVHGDGQNVRDWICVMDHCQGIAKIVKHGRAGEVYNIGSNNEKTNLEIANLILKTIGSRVSKVELVKDRPTNDKRYSINYDKISRELGYQPIYNFENYFADMIEWYKSNK